MKKVVLIVAAIVFLLLGMNQANAQLPGEPGFEGPFVVKSIERDPVSSNFIDMIVMHAKDKTWYILVYRDSYLSRFQIGEEIKIRLNESHDVLFWKASADESDKGWVGDFEIKIIAGIMPQSH